MNARQTRDKIEAFCATTAGNIGISTSNLKNVTIRVPPLSEQKRIVSKVTELLSLCDALEAKLTQAESTSTQFLSAAVHLLMQEDSREGAKDNSRMTPAFFASVG